MKYSRNFETHPLSPVDSLPLFIAAGVFKEPAQLERFYGIEDPAMAPLLILGGYTIPEWPGNAAAGEQDFVYYGSQGIAGNARGLPNGGKEAIKRLKGPIRRLSEVGVKTIIQVTNLPHENPLDVIDELVTTAAEVEPIGIEVNLSCPNGKKADGTFHLPLCNNPETSATVMEKARQAAGYEMVLGAKDSSHAGSLEDEVDYDSIQMLAQAIAPHIDYICGINTIGNQAFPELVCANGPGGMSGPAVAPISKQHLKAWREIAPDLAYLSCGGIDSANAETEIQERIDMGALRAGGAQEFYRSKDNINTLSTWALKWASSAHASID